MLIRSCAWLAIAVASIATLVGTFIVASGNNCWSAFAFTMMASGLGAGVLFLSVVPSWLRYFKTRKPDDWITLKMAGYSLIVLVIEAIALQIIPQRGE